MANILVIEDYPVHRDLLVRWLTRWGHTVAAVGDGVQGMAYAATGWPDLIVLDLHLPGMSGLEVTRRLKADPATARIRVIVLTAHLADGTRERCLAAGCDEFESKPPDFARLTPKFNFCVRGGRSPGNVPSMSGPTPWYNRGRGERQAAGSPTSALPLAPTPDPAVTASPGVAMSKTILVADDHASVRLLVAEYLREHDYRVLTAADGAEALLIARRERPDLILLDVMMPNLDGFAFMQVYRKQHGVPIIMLTARLEESDKVLGLELGADDYVTKPFSMKELLARVRAVLRRGAGAVASEADMYQVGDLVLDQGTRSVRVGSAPVLLTPSEFELLALLMAAPGRVSRAQVLLERLQGNSYEGVERTVDVHIRNLRKKIEPDPTQPRYIETVFGVGYRCRPDTGA